MRFVFLTFTYLPILLKSEPGFATCIAKSDIYLKLIPYYGYYWYFLITGGAIYDEIGIYFIPIHSI